MVTLPKTKGATMNSGKCYTTNQSYLLECSWTRKEPPYEKKKSTIGWSFEYADTRFELYICRQ